MAFKKSSILLLLGFLSSIEASPIAKRSSNGFKVSTKSAVATRDATPNKFTDNHATLTRKNSGDSRSFRYLKAMRSGKQENGAYAVGTAPLQSIEGGTEYDVQIQFADTTPVTVILDTGSSDTWLAQSSFQCVDETGADQPQSTCNFGPLFNGTFDNGQIANENFNISYGDGETLTGVLGYEDVTIAGIKVTNQEVALVNYAFWEGDGISSGLIGLAYPALTSAYAGDNPAADVPGDTVEYNSIFTTAINESLVAPMFSLALERAPSSGGYIAFGGLPPVSVDNSSFVSTPIEVLEIVDDPQTTSQYSFYTITPDGFTITPAAASRRSFRNGRQGIDVTSDFPTIVDSGTTLVYLPDELAIDINEAFEPSAEYVEDEGAFFVDCQATAPTFGVNINGTTFNVNPVDLIFQSEVDPTTGLCLTGIQAGGEGPFILGDVFLQNVVAVFDVGAAELRFAPHEDY